MSFLNKKGFTPILIQYARVAGRNGWIETVTLRIFDAKRCKRIRRTIFENLPGPREEGYINVLKRITTTE